MMRAAWTVSDALQASVELGDQPITIHALIHGPHDPRGSVLFVLDRDSEDLQNPSLVIRDQSVLEALLATAPCWVGGPMYQDDIEVTGVVRTAVGSASIAELTSVTRLVLFREGERFDVI